MASVFGYAKMTTALLIQCRLTAVIQPSLGHLKRVSRERPLSGADRGVNWPCAGEGVKRTHQNAGSLEIMFGEGTNEVAVFAIASPLGGGCKLAASILRRFAKHFAPLRHVIRRIPTAAATKTPAASRGRGWVERILLMPGPAGQGFSGIGI